MTTQKLIKISFIYGLREIVLEELKKQCPNFVPIQQAEDFLYIEYFENFEILKKLKSVSRVYIVLQDDIYHPKYLSKHKSILGELVELVLTSGDEKKFNTFKINCAGNKSSEVKEISRYITDTFQLFKTEEDADLKIHISKNNDIWELGIQITPRPLSVREYKINNMSGAIDPTIAHVMNFLSIDKNTTSYLNVFSGSATLLIEAMQMHPNFKKIIGFDNNKEHLSISIQNIKKAGYIKKIQVKEHSIFDNPDLGEFDVITADLPFGMVISKNEDLFKLYKEFISYAQNHLCRTGRLAIYTSNFEMLEEVLLVSKFSIVKKIPLKVVTSQELYLSTRIYICEL